ncbi:MAG: VWA domain-containing protein [Aeromicrobium erythreum]
MHRNLISTTAAVAAAAVVLASTVVGAPAASAADGSDDGSGRMMLVLDSSGSMKEPAAGGQTKIQAAKQALRSVVGSLPSEQAVGLRVYGAKVFDRSKPGACKDSQRVVDLGTDNRKALTDAIDDYKPYGETPIGYALQQAGKDLGSEGQRTIVLVSDGEPTCDPDPCKVAADLAKNGIDLKIDVVGLDVKGAARDKLRCIADKGRGTYYDADDADSLTESLSTAQTRASRPFDLTGTPIKGTPSPADAPVVKTGQYLDTVPVDGSLNYRFERTKPGSTLHVGVIFKGEGGSAGSGLTTSIKAPGDAVACESAIAFDSSYGERAPILYGSADSWKADAQDTCNTADELTIEIRSSRRNAGLAQQPVQLMVYEEPPVASTGSLPPAPDAPAWTPLQPGEPKKDVVAGTSITNAPVVEDGTYAGDLNPGESQVFAVPVGWGQHVSAQLDATITDQVRDAAAVGSNIEVSVLSPLGGEDTVSQYAKEPEDWSDRSLVGIRNTPQPYRTGAMSNTVAYLDRAASDERTRAGAVAGVRYVKVSFNVRGDEANLPYRLTLERGGDSTGAPDYEKVKGLRAPVADSRLVSGAGDEPGQEPTSARKADSSPAASGLPWLPIGLGLAGVLVIAAAIAILVRAGRRTV